MKVSSISVNAIENNIFSEQQSHSLVQSVQQSLLSVMKVINRIGTSIALGESEDFEAAHEFRVKEIA
jgi:hypothetical protein